MVAVSETSSTTPGRDDLRRTKKNQEIDPYSFFAISNRQGLPWANRQGLPWNPLGEINWDIDRIGAQL